MYFRAEDGAIDRYVGFLNEALYQLMLCQAEMYYFLPTYNEIETAYRCMAEFFFCLHRPLRGCRLYQASVGKSMF